MERVNSKCCLQTPSSNQHAQIYAIVPLNIRNIGETGDIYRALWLWYIKKGKCLFIICKNKILKNLIIAICIFSFDKKCKYFKFFMVMNGVVN